MCDVRCANRHRIKTWRARQTGKQGQAAWDRPRVAPDPRYQRKKTQEEVVKSHFVRRGDPQCHQIWGLWAGQ
jgi:hypothetical protein